MAEVIIKDVAIRKGILYLKARYCGIPHMIILIDGMALYFFSKSKRAEAYLKAEDCIAWYRKEITVAQQIEDYPKEEMELYQNNLEVIEKLQVDYL